MPSAAATAKRSSHRARDEVGRHLLPFAHDVDDENGHAGARRYVHVVIDGSRFARARDSNDDARPFVCRPEFHGVLELGGVELGGVVFRAAFAAASFFVPAARRP